MRIFSLAFAIAFAVAWTATDAAAGQWEQLAQTGGINRLKVEDPKNKSELQKKREEEQGKSPGGFSVGGSTAMPGEVGKNRSTNLKMGGTGEETQTPAPGSSVPKN